MHVLLNANTKKSQANHMKNLSITIFWLLRDFWNLLIIFQIRFSFFIIFHRYILLAFYKWPETLLFQRVCLVWHNLVIFQGIRSELSSWHILLEVSLAFRGIQLSRSSERKTMLSLVDYFSSHLIALVEQLSWGF